MVNFGALTGFLALHLSVVTHFMLRRKSRRWFMHLVSPVIGFAIIAYVLINAEANAKIAGLSWMAVGIAVVVALKLTGRRADLLLDEETQSAISAKDETPAPPVRSTS
jgi:amino acid transporter